MAEADKQGSLPAKDDTPAAGSTAPPPRQVPETKDPAGGHNPGPHQEHAGERS